MYYGKFDSCNLEANGLFSLPIIHFRIKYKNRTDA